MLEILGDLAVERIQTLGERNALVARNLKS